MAIPYPPKSCKTDLVFPTVILDFTPTATEYMSQPLTIMTNPQIMGKMKWSDLNLSKMLSDVMTRATETAQWRRASTFRSCRGLEFHPGTHIRWITTSCNSSYRDLESFLTYKCSCQWSCLMQMLGPELASSCSTVKLSPVSLGAQAAIELPQLFPSYVFQLIR